MATDLKNNPKTKGVALITVLVIVALLTPLTTKLMLSQQLLVKRITVGAHFNNATMYALAVETWGRQLLREDRQNSEHDGLNEVWAQTIFPLSVDGGSVTGKLDDLQGRYNLNNFQATDQQIFKKRFLLLCADLDIETAKAKAVVQALEDWFDEDDDIRLPAGAEDLDYENLDLPYRTAKKRLLSVSELRLVRGVSQDVWQKLSPYVAALPEVGTKININTASAPVLKSLFPEKAWRAIDLFVQEHSRFSFESLEKFAQDYHDNVGEPLPEDIKTLIGVKSDYFVAQVHASFGEGKVQMRTLLSRAPSGETKVQFRSFGPL